MDVDKMDPVLCHLNLRDLRQLSLVNKRCLQLVRHQFDKFARSSLKRHFRDGIYEENRVHLSKPKETVIQLLSDEKEVLVICVIRETNKSTLYSYNSSTYKLNYTNNFGADRTAFYYLLPKNLMMLYKASFHVMSREGSNKKFMKVVSLMTFDRMVDPLNSAVKNKLVMWDKHLVAIVDTCLWYLTVEFGQEWSDENNQCCCDLSCNFDVHYKWQVQIGYGAISRRMVTMDPLLAAVPDGFYMLGRHLFSNDNIIDQPLCIDLLSYRDVNIVLKTFHLEQWHIFDTINVVPIIDSSTEQFFCTKSLGGTDCVSVELVDFTHDLLTVVDKYTLEQVESIHVANDKFHCGSQMVQLPYQKYYIDLKTRKLCERQWCVSDMSYACDANDKHEFAKLQRWKTSDQKQVWMDQDRIFYVDWNGQLKSSDFLPRKADREKRNNTISALEALLTQGSYDHILDEIISKLNMRDMSQLSMVNKSMHQLVQMYKEKMRKKLAQNWLEGNMSAFKSVHKGNVVGSASNKWPIWVLSDLDEIFVIHTNMNWLDQYDYLTRRTSIESWSVSVYNGTTYEEKHTMVLMKELFKPLYNVLTCMNKLEVTPQSFVLTPQFLILHTFDSVHVWERQKERNRLMEVAVWQYPERKRDPTELSRFREFCKFVSNSYRLPIPTETPSYSKLDVCPFGMVVYDNHIVLVTSRMELMMLDIVTAPNRAGKNAYSLKMVWRYDLQIDEAIEDVRFVLDKRPLVAATEEGFFMIGSFGQFLQHALDKKQKTEIPCKNDIVTEADESSSSEEEEENPSASSCDDSDPYGYDEEHLYRNTNPHDNPSYSPYNPNNCLEIFLHCYTDGITILYKHTMLDVPYDFLNLYTMPILSNEKRPLFLFIGERTHTTRDPTDMFLLDFYARKTIRKVSIEGMDFGSPVQMSYNRLGHCFDDIGFVPLPTEAECVNINPKRSSKESSKSKKVLHRTWSVKGLLTSMIDHIEVTQEVGVAYQNRQLWASHLCGPGGNRFVWLDRDRLFVTQWNGDLIVIELL